MTQKGLAGGGRSDAVVTVESLYRDYRGPLLAYCVNLAGGDRHWAEDVMQETMVRAWRCAEELDPAAESMMPWLATVARRIVIDAQRARRRRPQEVGAEPLYFVPVRDPIEPMLHRIAVTAAVRELPPPQRAVVVEMVLRDRTLGDAARRLDVPVGTVKSRMHYAVRALRASLAEPLAS